MPKQQRKEPWNSEIYPRESRRESGKRENRSEKKDKKKKGQASTVFLTLLVVIMFVIIGATIIFTIYNSSNPNPKSAAKQFFPSANRSSVISSSSDLTNKNSDSSSGDNSSDSSGSSSDDSSSDTSSSEADGSTYTIIAGDYPSLIASKTGVPWTDIVKFNPTLDPNNPGYYKNGSQLTVGQVLKIKK